MTDGESCIYPILSLENGTGARPFRESF